LLYLYFVPFTCGNTPEHCEGSETTTTTTPPTTILLTRERFDCIFDQLHPSVRDKRWQ
ncbi:unnamed protein product, partial [Rotaria sp. Silwood1]